MRLRAALIGSSSLAFLLCACQPDSTPAFQENVEPQTLQSVGIATPDQALTFARYLRDGRPHVLAVQSYVDGKVTGIDLGQALGSPEPDPVSLFRQLDYERFAAFLDEADDHYRITVPADELVAPVDLAERHIAVGANYPEHADEATVKEGPFLFPKHVKPTGPHAEVPAGDALLDYEVELAWITLAPLARGSETEHMGVIVVNDYTDRATLLRHINVDDVESGDGFTTGKSFPGALPVGNLFVIPRDYRTFAESLELKLYVNNRLRQQSPVSSKVWNHDEILRQIWSRRDWQWDYRGKQVSLLGEGEVIAPRTLIMSGTPQGTIFNGISPGQKIRGLGAWLLSGLDGSLPSHVIDVYISDAGEGGYYLQPDDRVVIHVDKLGVIDNRIIQ